MDSLVKYSKNLGIDKNINFVGESHDVSQFYNKMDVFVLTSHFEGLPNVVMEAMASSLPVVAVNVGGTRELIRENITGFLCTANCANVLADKVIFLIKNQEKATIIGMNARSHIKKYFGIKKMISLTEDTYLNLLGI
jgi:glycosyltransferase involved in cell wall biosynthesis